MSNLDRNCRWPNCSCKTEQNEPCKFENPDFYINRAPDTSENSTMARVQDRTKPLVITLCGSSRFPDAFALANLHLTMQGHIVIGLGCFGHADLPAGARYLTSDGDETTPEKQHLDQLHLRKIDISDGIFVINPGGYIGASTRREIEYARGLSKTVEFMFT